MSDRETVGARSGKVPLGILRFRRSCGDIDIVTGRQLRVLFATLNQQYWDGRLPTYRVGRKEIKHQNQGVTDNAKMVIWIDSRPERVSDGEIRQVLLHEMCHTLKRCSSHGKQFQRQLARLAARGEAWAEHQRQEYAATPPGPRLSGKAVRDFIRLHLMLDPNASWQVVKRALADDQVVPVTELSRRFPAARSWFSARSRLHRSDDTSRPGPPVSTREANPASRPRATG